MTAARRSSTRVSPTPRSTWVIGAASRTFHALVGTSRRCLSHRRSTSLVIGACALALSNLVACGGATRGFDEEAGGEGGAATQGGAPQKGGASGASSGGRVGTGGTLARGGTSAGGSGNVGAFGGVVGVGGSLNLGGTSAGASGSSGYGGSAAAPSCMDSDGSDPTLRGRAIGTNGTFTDSCDDAGNLLEYSCEVKYTTSYPCPQTADARAPGSEAAGGAAGIALPACPPVQTGLVVETPWDCSGTCRLGACFTNCPKQGDTVQFVSGRAQAVVIDHLASGTRYVCDVIFAQPNYDCASPTLEGLEASVASTGACSISSAIFGTDDPRNGFSQECTYECSAQ